MDLKAIKKINQNIYELDIDITRSNKVIFIASLIFCITCNKDFQNPNKVTSLIDFVNEKTKPIDQIIELAITEIRKLHLIQKTEDAIINSLKTISGVNTNLDRNREAFKEFIQNFISEVFPLIKPKDLFLETLYMEIDKKATTNDKGIVLTPIFASELMIELANIDYKKDIVTDLCSGTGLFSLLSYSKMLNNMDLDFKNKVITEEEYITYKKKLFNSIIANDNEPKMVTLCLANFLLKSLNHKLIFYENILNLEKSHFKIYDNQCEEKIKPTKAILNPPYEDTYKPLEILEKNIVLLKNDEIKGKRLVCIIPPQKFGNKRDVFARILNISTLESVIKMQDDLFTDSGSAPSTSIFIFNVDKPHSKDDIIKYYDFTDTGYIYLKDSGLVDKNNTFNTKKQQLLERMNNSSNKSENSFKRTWTNFYEVNKVLETEAKIDPDKVKISKEEADITLENITIKRMLKEKDILVSQVNNNFKDLDGSFEKYIVDILSED